MELSFLPLLIFLHLSQALLLPLNSSLLHLTPQDTVLLTGEPGPREPFHLNPWPDLPYARYIRNSLTINITAYGDTVSSAHTSNALHALLAIQDAILEGGDFDDILEATTTVGETSGVVYAEVGFYSLIPPSGITRSEAGDVIHKAWQLCIEFSPAREITSSTIIYKDVDLALFRMSFRRA